jgi:hydroxymethylbilane synthase
MILKIGTRGSNLALAQSLWIKERIETAHPHLRVRIVKIKTRGDKILDSPLSKIGGKGLFVKEIEEALLNKRIDLAVHSMKDIPAQLPKGLILGAFPEREDPFDALISKNDYAFSNLPRGAKVGTGSLRRSAQVKHVRPDLVLIPVRGNVDTRLKKMDAGEFDAVILAAAGLKRLGMNDRITEVIPAGQILPAIGQGALGLEVREADEKTIGLLSFLNHDETEVTVRAERAFLKKLEGGCQVPIAAYARLLKGDILLEGLVAELDGSILIRDEITGEKERAEETGIALAKRLLESGAGKILEKIYGIP